MVRLIERRIAQALLPVFVLLASSCGERKEDALETPPVAVEYADLPTHVGKRVIVTAWVLGSGDALRISGNPDNFYFILVPNPEVDWKAFFADYEAVERLIADLSAGDPAGRAEAKHVSTFSRLQAAFQTWRGLIHGQEARDDVTAWGHFAENVVGGEFSAIPEGPLVLVTPTRQELFDSASRLLEDFQAIERSAEVEAMGTLVRTVDPPSGESAQPLPAALSKKPFLLHIESFKVLRTARDMLREGPSVGTGAAPLAQPEGDGK